MLDCWSRPHGGAVDHSRRGRTRAGIAPAIAGLRDGDRLIGLRDALQYRAARNRQDGVDRLRSLRRRA